ncbi:TetR/AcrR family transcriptional regulator [Azospirillum halopraeferens]|uniref:TetR/AcrR family transcriptional regulator n=1 Tax=Azospirillum halopraeferens TaxID=34010 RepID=UPI000413A196|nr:TetR/AcrR family transcriptional regulator [Azospirillum halopraeferens]
MPDKDAPARRPRGRPRGFDRDEALAAATATFWRLGYEGASIADLTAAMGITPQSLYAAFRSKADLHREALEWYRANVGADASRALAEEADVVEAIDRLLRDSARTFSRHADRRGCMVSTAVLACAAENRPVADHAAALRRDACRVLEERIARGIADGQLRPDCDAAALARYVGAVIQGMSVQARDGADEADLTAIATLALDALTSRRA